MQELIPLLPRYLELRRAGLELNNALIRTLAKDELKEGASKIGMLSGNTFVFDSEDQSAVLMDFCLHDVWREGRNATQRFIATSPPPSGSEAARLLDAKVAARHSIFVVEKVTPGVGLQVLDALGGGSSAMIDLNFSQTAMPGATLAMRIIHIDGITMSTGAAIPADFRVLERVRGQLDPLLHGGPPLDELPAQQRSDVTAMVIRTCLKSDVMAEIKYETPTAATATGFSDTVAPRRPGRNEPCPCGSGKKYKKCCGG